MDEIYDKLKSIGDAVREKTGVSGLLTLDDMAEKINLLKLVGGFLTVIAEPDAVITVTNGDKSFTKTAGSDGNAVFNGLGDGTWTITGVLDGSTVIETISIDTAYSKQLKFVTYLYTNGTLFSPISSGFVDGSRGGITIENTGDKLKCSGNSYYIQCYDMSSDSIDLIGYNWLYVDVYSCNGSFYIGFDNENYDTSINVNTPMNVGMNFASPGVYKVSLNGINTESHKIGIGLNYHEDNATKECLINKIWICPDDIYDATLVDQDFFMIGG